VRSDQLERGVPTIVVDDNILYFASVLLLVGLACNLLIRPLSSRPVAVVTEQRS